MSSYPYMQGASRGGSGASGNATGGLSPLGYYGFADINSYL
jgi:hypothetical protein